MHPSTFRGSMLGMIWCSVPSQEVFGSIGYNIYIYITIINYYYYYHDDDYYYCYYYYFYFILLLLLLSYN